MKRLLLAVLCIGCSSVSTGGPMAESDAGASELRELRSEGDAADAGVLGAGGSEPVGSGGAMPEAAPEASGGGVGGFCTPLTSNLVDYDDAGQVERRILLDNVRASCDACNPDLQRCTRGCPPGCETFGSWDYSICCCPTDPPPGPGCL